MNFALKLLGTLFGLAFEFVNRPLHAGNHLLFLGDPEFQSLLGLQLRFVADSPKRFLNPLFDGQLHLSLGIVEFALLANQFGLSVLGLSKLFVALL